MIKHDFEQHSEAWYLARCGRITGIRFKELMAGKETKTYQDLILTLACEIITEKQEDSYTSADMLHGTETEPIARKAYEEIMETEAKEIGFITPDEDNPFNEWVGISPDGLLSDGGLLEIKCPKPKTHLGYIEGNKLPTEYRHQVQGQLFVTGAPYCDFMSFVEDMKPFIIRVYPDEKLHQDYTQRLSELIQEVKNKLNIYEQYN